MAYFAIEAQGVDDLQDPVVVKALYSGLKDNKYADLVQRLAKMLAKAMARA